MSWTAFLMRLIPAAALFSQYSLYAFSNSAAPATIETARLSEGIVIVALGKDSPPTGKDAFVTWSLSMAEAVNVGKIVSEISYANKGQIEFDKAELTPDVKGTGANLQVEKGESGGETVRLKLTLTAGKGSIPDGIIANLVFKVISRPSGDNPAELKLTLNNKSAAWTVDNSEITVVTSEPGEVDFEYAPVIFSCFFYMH